MSLMASLCVLIMGATQCDVSRASYSRCTSQAHGPGDFIDRQRGREPPFGDRRLKRGQAGFERRVAFEPRDQPLVKHGPQPFDLLLLAPRRKLAGAGETLAVLKDPRPEGG